MTTEQKTKAYDKALEQARRFHKAFVSGYNYPAADIKASYEALFPELKMTEDDKIVDAIRKALESKIEDLGNGVTKTACLAWLEKLKEPKDKGEISDGYHTFNELYYYRMLYNAAFFNLLPKEWVHKSKKHHDGEECFGGGWFIVMANLPTGQISNHYELKDWDLFQIQEKEIADEWDGHTPQEAADRLHNYLLDCQKVSECSEIEAEAPMGYGKIIEEKLQEAVKHYFADEKDPDRYCLADVFYAGMRTEREMDAIENNLVWKDAKKELPIIDDENEEGEIPYIGIYCNADDYDEENEDFPFMDIVYFYGRGWKNNRWEKIIVKYWMEIPQPPK